MKKIFLYIILSIISVSLFSQNQIISKADELISQKKYFSAYQILANSDPNNQNPAIAIARTNLLMNYHISTDLYQTFELKDLAPNESIRDFEKRKQTFNTIEFAPDSILTKLKKQYPNNFSLPKALGSYYYEVHLKYPNEWLEDNETIVKKLKDNYNIAYLNGEYDYWSLFGLGYVALLEKDNQSAINYLEKSIELNPDYPITYYDLACAYSNMMSYSKAIDLALISLEKQTIPSYKAETARFLGINYAKLGQKEKSYEYFLTANQLQPNNYDNLISLLQTEIILNKIGYKERTIEIFELAPDNAIVFKDIMEAYKKGYKLDHYIEFLENQKPYYRTNNTALANLYFYIGVSFYEKEEWVKSKINFEKSRNLFRNIYSSEHQIFKVIDSYTDAIKKK